MATLAQPGMADEPKRPNIAKAGLQLPAVKDYEQVDREIMGTLRPTKAWVALLSTAIACLAIGAASWIYQIYAGLGVAGYSPPVMWGVYIITFVFWIGIGHAGTLISAILYLFRAGFRTTIYRCAEAMTVFAVMTAGLFPIIHIGRPWKFFWLIPYPNWRLLWPNFKSPLVWDVFAISTYLTISTTFLFIGLIPDIAVLRDREKNPTKKAILSALSFGWRNSEAEWRHFVRAYLFLAAFSTPLVLSVHSVVSFDFAMALTPGWHTTIFPPYFVAGAVYAGFAMVLTLAIPLRALYGLEDFITMHHLENMAKVTLVTGLIVVYGYACEAFFGWYSANGYERFMLKNRMWSGPMAWSYWALLLCNFIVPQILWSKKMRRNLVALFTVAMFVNVGMWLERFVIIVTSLHRDFVPSSWEMYYPTVWDFMTLAGTIGLFLTGEAGLEDDQVQQKYGDGDQGQDVGGRRLVGDQDMYVIRHAVDADEKMSFLFYNAGDVLVKLFLPG